MLEQRSQLRDEFRHLSARCPTIPQRRSSNSRARGGFAARRSCATAPPAGVVSIHRAVGPPAPQQAPRPPPRNTPTCGFYAAASSVASVEWPESTCAECDQRTVSPCKSTGQRHVAPNHRSLTPERTDDTPSVNAAAGCLVRNDRRRRAHAPLSADDGVETDEGLFGPANDLKSRLQQRRHGYIDPVLENQGRGGKHGTDATAAKRASIVFGSTVSRPPRFRSDVGG
jgi:hypothetical protein